MQGTFFMENDKNVRIETAKYDKLFPNLSGTQAIEYIRVLNTCHQDNWRNLRCNQKCKYEKLSTQ